VRIVQGAALVLAFGYFAWNAAQLIRARSRLGATLKSQGVGSGWPSPFDPVFQSELSRRMLRDKPDADAVIGRRAAVRAGIAWCLFGVVILSVVH
jgi:hypothetical protein